MVINTKELIDKVKDLDGDIVLTGGCFDVLHIGHIVFLNKSKEYGKTLVVLLESDERIKRLKGENRPINNQNDRAEILVNLKSVDVVVKLPPEDIDYSQIVKLIGPKVITATEGDKIMEIKRQQAEDVGAELKIVPFVPDKSTTRIIELLL
jgi:D-beta-D-heptose 7-phosphate kinase/D-beta-D-heptose 1-phosphate adenosyltransferase